MTRAHHLNKRLGGDLGTDLDAEYRRHGTQGGHCRQVVGWETQMEQGWRGRYAGKGSGHTGSQAARHTRKGTRLVGKQAKKSGSRGRQKRVRMKDWVGQTARAGE
jgi:hypothetical protein